MSIKDIAKQYSEFSQSTIMRRIASYAHGNNYIGQTSSANFNEVSNIIESYCPRVESILDLGCGNANITARISEYFNCRTVGVEISDKLIEDASNHPKIEIFHGDFNNIPHSLKGSFDCILSVGSLYWNQDLLHTLKHWQSFLSDKGKIIIFTNLSMSEIPDIHLKSLENTRFIKSRDMHRYVENLNLLLSEIDGNITYYQWLKKWVHKTNEIKSSAKDDVSNNFIERISKRFETYLDLCSQGIVKRKILVIERKK